MTFEKDSLKFSWKVSTANASKALLHIILASLTLFYVLLLKFSALKTAQEGPIYSD